MVEVDNSHLLPQQKLDLHMLHGRYEMERDLEMTMNTLVADPVYRFNGRLMVGQDAVRSWYKDVIMKIFSWDNFEVLNSIPAEQGLAHEFTVQVDWRGKKHLIRGTSFVHFDGDKMRGESLFLADPFEEIVRELVDLDALITAETDL